MRTRTISVDIDGTYGEDPDMWDLFCKQATSRGHKIVFVTYRHAHETCHITERIKAQGYEIFFTGKRAKIEFMADKVHIDIWIDDVPLCILQSNL